MQNIEQIGGVPTCTVNVLSTKGDAGRLIEAP